MCLPGGEKGEFCLRRPRRWEGFTEKVVLEAVGGRRSHYEKV